MSPATRTAGARQAAAGGGSRTLYAEKLFAPGRGGRRPGRGPALRGGPPAGAPHRRLALPAVGVFLVLGAGLASFILLAGPGDSGPEQRPRPGDYRTQLDLVSIDRVGSMFLGVVSQGFFLQTPDEQRRAIERLIRRVDSEGYRSLYLTEPSGRELVRWDSSGVRFGGGESPAGS